MKNITLLSVIFVFVPSILFCQTSRDEVEKKIKNELDSIRLGSRKASDYHFDSSNEKYFLAYVKKYDNDESIKVRSRVQNFKARIALTTRDTSIRREIVDDFLSDVSNPEQIISQYALSRLLTFKQNDFSKRAKELIVQIFNQSNYRHDFLLICGTAQVNGLIGKIKDISKGFNKGTQGWNRTTEWYASLAAARMGVTEKVDELIAAVESESDPVAKAASGLKYMAYTRQPKCIKLLQKYLESSDRLHGLKDDDPGVGVNQYALEYLAQYIDNFPIKRNGIGYSQKEIDRSIIFMKQKYGDVKSN